MSASILPPEMLGAQRSRWDAAIEIGLAALLAFMPAAFGAVDAWSELIALGLAAILSIAVVLRAMLDRSFALPWTWAYVPLATFVALTALQMTPLPRGLVRALSPASVEIPGELLGDSIASGGAATISLYSPATEHGLRLVLLGTAVFFVTISCFRTVGQIRRLLWIVFVIGCAEAGFGACKIFTATKRLYWALDAGTSRLTSGSFINYSNFSQFMNLSIGAGLALLLMRLVGPGWSGAGRRELSRPFGGARLSDQGGLMAGLILCAIAILASMSRNGAISMVVAGLIVGTALFAHGLLSRRGWVLAALPLGALAVLLAYGFDAVYERLASVGQGQDFAGRWELTRDVLRAWQAFPALGAGLGVHEYVFPMFDTSETSAFAGHADNDYAQLLEETGVTGALCVAVFAATIAALLVRLCRKGRDDLAAAGFGLAFGLVAVAIHSGSDFGQHVPAIFCLSAVTCGLIVQLSRLDRGDTTEAEQPSLHRHSVVVPVIALLAFLGMWAWALCGAYGAHLGEQWWAAASLLDDEIQQAGPSASDGEHADLLAAAKEAASSQPDNVTYGYWLNLWRWRAMSRDVDPATGAAQFGAECSSRRDAFG